MIDVQIINAEVLFAIGQFPASYHKRIPQSLIDNLYNFFSKKRFNELDVDKPFYKQNIGEEALEVVNDIILTYLL